MDPETTRIVLKLQLDDVHAILKALPSTSNDGAVNSERVAFAALRDELTRKWQEVHGRVFAHNMIRKENAGRESFRKLLNEEQQAERDHDMACTLAGQPVPQRPVVSADNGVHNNAAAQKQEPIDHRTLASDNLRFDLSGTQVAPTRPEPQQGKKRLAEDDPKPAPASSNFKRARVDDADDRDKNSVTPYTHESSLKKRAACVDAAILREKDDGRTKRTKLDPQAETAPIADATKVPSSDTVCEKEHVQTGAKPDLVLSRTCSSCFDMHPIRDTIQLQCRNTGDAERHAYCRDCIMGLFEACITDSSQFPPRCCNQILPVFACIPFLPPELFARYVAKREELETRNRTYCSNFLCAKWVRPCNIAAGIATCVNCAQKTCATCKKKQHAGLCLEDQDVKKLMDVAKAKRWKTCPKCKEMIELEAGCYHIKYV
ncbi:uncharacterized protein J4E87_006315 [Alternaria ethzedia]|uniref:uncharacterized protein n=1 Tax=Alternaria ethzedia TaxID=181014 RepID=UPI0020C32310|nr:uncharacterized protein J4E87_006315 [Alternaria ethzedia]KAI4622748.1 hypothetical protein J4E87_006315 [Alternaria ethzedia]